MAIAVRRTNYTGAQSTQGTHHRHTQHRIHSCRTAARFGSRKTHAHVRVGAPYLNIYIYWFCMVSVCVYCHRIYCGPPSLCSLLLRVGMVHMYMYSLYMLADEDEGSVRISYYAYSYRYFILLYRLLYCLQSTRYDACTYSTYQVWSMVAACVLLLVYRGTTVFFARLHVVFGRFRKSDDTVFELAVVSASIINLYAQGYGTRNPYLLPVLVQPSHLLLNEITSSILGFCCAFQTSCVRRGASNRLMSLD